MNRLIGRRSRLLAALGVAALMLTGALGPVAAAERPVARIVFSFTCNATGDPFCAPEYFGFRYTAILWPDGTGETQGSFDMHQRGGPASGGTPINDEIEWTAPTGPLNLAVAVDPNDLYYNLGVGTLSFPQTAGHYAYRPLPGTSAEITVVRY